MIEIDRLSQVFQTCARKDHLALSDITLQIEDGSFVSVLRPSGCGKSTLLHSFSGARMLWSSEKPLYRWSAHG